MNVNETAANEAAQLYIAHYRRGLAFALTQKGNSFTGEDASDARYGNYHAIHARGAVRSYVSAEIDALSDRKAAAGHSQGLSVEELRAINDAFWNRVSKFIGLDEKDIREDVERMDRIGHLASAFQNLQLAQHYERQQGGERVSAGYINDSRRILTHLNASGDDYEKLDTKGLMESVETIIAFEQIQLSARPRKPVLEQGIYSARTAITAEA